MLSSVTGAREAAKNKTDPPTPHFHGIYTPTRDTDHEYNGILAAQNSPKHRAASHQTFLKLRARIGQASFLPHSLGENESGPAQILEAGSTQGVNPRKQDSLGASLGTKTKSNTH